MNTFPVIRASVDGDVVAIAEIYGHYVRATTSTFEIDPPDAAEIGRRRGDILTRGLPHLVAEVAGAVVGYAYAVPYRPRLAYRFTVEDSIYIHPEHLGRGVGRLLLAAVIEACEQSGYRQMVAVIGGSDNAASIGLHSAMGFVPAGLLRAVGFKFGRWADSVLMQRKLGSGDETVGKILGG
jgi:phosphinothricin acetyltransferase